MKKFHHLSSTDLLDGRWNTFTFYIHTYKICYLQLLDAFHIWMQVWHDRAEPQNDMHSSVYYFPVPSAALMRHGQQNEHHDPSGWLCCCLMAARLITQSVSHCSPEGRGSTYWWDITSSWSAKETESVRHLAYIVFRLVMNWHTSSGRKFNAAKRR